MYSMTRRLSTQDIDMSQKSAHRKKPEPVCHELKGRHSDSKPANLYNSLFCSGLVRLPAVSFGHVKYTAAAIPPSTASVDTILRTANAEEFIARVIDSKVLSLKKPLASQKRRAEQYSTSKDTRKHEHTAQKGYFVCPTVLA